MSALVGREWVWGEADCWTLVRDWYLSKGLVLPDWQRPTIQEFEAAPMFDDCWKAAGFYELEADVQLQEGDALLLCIGDNKSNHVGIFMASGEILHHLKNHLSRHDNYGLWLQSATTRRLRHEAFKP